MTLTSVLQSMQGVVIDLKAYTILTYCRGVVLTHFLSQPSSFSSNLSFCIVAIVDCGKLIR
jgi:hypothetical protein